MGEERQTLPGTGQDGAPSRKVPGRGSGWLGIGGRPKAVALVVLEMSFIGFLFSRGARSSPRVPTVQLHELAGMSVHLILSGSMHLYREQRPGKETGNRNRTATGSAASWCSPPTPAHPPSKCAKQTHGVPQRRRAWAAGKLGVDSISVSQLRLEVNGRRKLTEKAENSKPSLTLLTSGRLWGIQQEAGAWAVLGSGALKGCFVF